MKTLLLGDDGQIGGALKTRLPRLGPVCGMSYPAIDFMDAAQVRRVVREEQPDLIVNAAAYTAVDAAEADVEAATRINAAAPRVLAEEAERQGIPLVHYSTDFVFDGEQDQPYRETDPPAPLGVYAQSKLDGDLAIAEVLPRHVILRASWIYGQLGSNFLLTIRRLAEEGRPLRIVDDQVGSPTWCHAVADGTLAILEQLVGHQARADAETLWGTYHMTCGGATSWYGFARAFLSDDADVVPCTTADYPTPARRPAYSVLDCTKLKTTFGVALPRWQDALQDCLKDDAS